MRKIIIALIFLALVVAYRANGATILFPHSGGTGFGSATAGDVGDCLKVTDDSPFTYELGTCGSGSSLNATSTEPLMASWFVATSSTATSTFPQLSITEGISILGEYFENFTTYVRSLFTESTGIDISSGAIAFDSTEIGNTTWGSNSDFTWTFDSLGSSVDSSLTFSNTRTTYSGNQFIIDAAVPTLTLQDNTAGHDDVSISANSSIFNLDVGGVPIITAGAAGALIIGDSVSGALPSVEIRSDNTGDASLVVPDDSISLSTEVTGTLPIANGGTNITSLSTNSLMFFNGTSITSTSSDPLYVSIITATSTTEASILPLASTTQITATNNAYLATSGGGVAIGTSLSPVVPLEIDNSGTGLQLYRNSSTAGTESSICFRISTARSATCLSSVGAVRTNNPLSADEGLIFKVTQGGVLREALRIDPLGNGLGTTTPRWGLQISTSTASQLTLSDPSVLTNNHWSFRNAGGLLFLATSSPTTFATSSVTTLKIDTSGDVTFGKNIITASSTKVCFDLICSRYLTGAASSTIEMWINNQKVEEWGSD